MKTFDDFWMKLAPPGDGTDDRLNARGQLTWYFGQRLTNAERDGQGMTRERVYALMVLLLRRYMLLIRKCPEHQRAQLHATLIYYYEMLEEKLDDLDPPIPGWVSGVTPPAPPAEEDNVIELFQDSE